MRPHRGIVLASLFAGLGACSSSPGSIKVTVSPIAVTAGTEAQNCYYLKAPNDEPVEIGHVTVDFGPGTHHAHIYYGAEAHEDGVEECFHAVDFDKWHLLVAAQREKLDWELPEGVGFQLGARQQLLVQVHYTNVGKLLTDNNTGGGTFTLERRRPQDIRQHMGSIFGQQRNIHMAPHSTFSVEGLCKLPREVDLAAFAGHYHFRGRDFIGYKTDLTGVPVNEFYRSDNFAEPAFDMYGPSKPMHFGTSEQLMWHCDYDNQTGQEISFGPREVDQEHCNLFAFYYPAMSAQEFTPCVSWDRCATPCTESQTCSKAGQCVAR